MARPLAVRAIASRNAGPDRETGLLLPHREKSASAAGTVLHSPGYDPRKRVVSAASDEGVEEVMRKIVIAIQFDQHRIAGRHVRDRQLRAKLFDDRLSVC